MARTSRDPFSPLVPMKKKKNNVKKAAVPAVVPAALGTWKKKKTTASAHALDAESISPRKPPPEDMPSYVPYSKRNAHRSSRVAAPQPPTLLYIPSLPPIADGDCYPLDHNSPHKDPPAEFVEKAARAADPSDAMEDNDDEEEEEPARYST